MLWKGSDLIVAAGKSTEEHFAQKGLNDGVKEFLAQIQGKGHWIWNGGIWDFYLRDTKTWMSMYQYGFVCLFDGYRVAME